MVESRMLYVGKEERMIAVRNIFALYKNTMCNIHPPCAPRGAPDPSYSMLRHRLMSPVTHTDPELRSSDAIRSIHPLQS